MTAVHVEAGSSLDGEQTAVVPWNNWDSPTSAADTPPSSCAASPAAEAFVVTVAADAVVGEGSFDALLGQEPPWTDRERETTVAEGWRWPKSSHLHWPLSDLEPPSYSSFVAVLAGPLVLNIAAAVALEECHRIHRTFADVETGGCPVGSCRVVANSFLHRLDTFFFSIIPFRS